MAASSACVLTYDAVANAAAWTLPDRRRTARLTAGGGLAGCTALVLTLPVADIAGGAAVLGAGALAWCRTGRVRPRRTR